MRTLGASLATRLRKGDLVLLFGELGAGKTTLVRGFLGALGHGGPVRSPTFNLIQVFDTDPPVMHADLYRVENARDLGIEDYLDTHLCFIEWAERAEELAQGSYAWSIRISIAGDGREVEVQPPATRA